MFPGNSFRTLEKMRCGVFRIYAARRVSDPIAPRLLSAFEKYPPAPERRGLTASARIPGPEQGPQRAGTLFFWAGVTNANCQDLREGGNPRSPSAAAAAEGWHIRARPRPRVTLSLRTAGGPQRPAPASFLPNLPPRPKQMPRATHLPTP